MPDNTWRSWGESYGYNPEGHGFLKSLGFVDSSYRNHSAPSFHHSELELNLWVDAVKPEDREYQGPLLSLVQMDEDMKCVAEVFAAKSWRKMAAKLRQVSESQRCA